MNKLTKEQAIVVTGFTGVTCCNFSDFQADAERRMGRSVWTHEFGSDVFAEQVRELYRDDFLSLIPEGA